MADPGDRAAATSPVPSERPTTPWALPFTVVALGAAAILLLVLPTHSPDSGYGGLYSSLTAGVLAVMLGVIGLVRSREHGLPTAVLCAVGMVAGSVPLVLVGGEVVSNVRMDRTIPDEQLRALGEAVDVPVYYLGSVHDGAELVDAFGSGDSVVRGLGDDVVALFIYADGCGLINPYSCAKDLQIYVERECFGDARFPRDARELTIRGVPAVLSGSPPSAEAELTLWTGGSALRFHAFGFSGEEMLAAAERLRGLNVDVPPGDDLPAPTC
jgi:hypothetical protein